MTVLMDWHQYQVEGSLLADMHLESSRILQLSTITRKWVRDLYVIIITQKSCYKDCCSILHESHLVFLSTTDEA